MTFGIQATNDFGNLFIDGFNKSYVFNGIYNITFTRITGQFIFTRTTSWPSTLRNPIFFYKTTNSSSYGSGQLCHSQTWQVGSNVNTLFVAGSSNTSDSLNANIWVFETVANTTSSGWGMDIRNASSELVYSSLQNRPLNIKAYAITVGSSSSSIDLGNVNYPFTRGTLPANWAICAGSIISTTRQDSFIFTYAKLPLPTQVAGANYITFGIQNQTFVNAVTGNVIGTVTANNQYILVIDTSEYASQEITYL